MSNCKCSKKSHIFHTFSATHTELHKHLRIIGDFIFVHYAHTQTQIFMHWTHSLICKKVKIFQKFQLPQKSARLNQAIESGYGRGLSFENERSLATIETGIINKIRKAGTKFSIFSVWIAFSISMAWTILSLAKVKTIASCMNKSTSDFPSWIIAVSSVWYDFCKLQKLIKHYN